MKTIEDYREQLESALAYGSGTHLFEDVVEAVAAGKMQAWPNGDSIAITEIIAFPRKKTLHGFLAAGNMREILEMVPSAAEWGRQQGCTAFTLAGRKGWQRVFGKRGWRTAFYVLETEL